MILNKQIKVAHVLFIACAIFLYFFINKKKPVNDGYSKYEKEIDSINNVIYQLKVQQNRLDSIILRSNHIIDSISLQIGDTKKQIQKVKKDYNEKINSINNSTPSQLQQFFTDRYK